jgi:hypothetical protein
MLGGSNGSSSLASMFESPSSAISAYPDASSLSSGLLGFASPTTASPYTTDTSALASGSISPSEEAEILNESPTAVNQQYNATIAQESAAQSSQPGALTEADFGVPGLYTGTELGVTPQMVSDINTMMSTPLSKDPYVQEALAQQGPNGDVAQFLSQYAQAVANPTAGQNNIISQDNTLASSLGSEIANGQDPNLLASQTATTGLGTTSTATANSGQVSALTSQLSSLLGELQQSAGTTTA